MTRRMNSQALTILWHRHGQRAPTRGILCNAPPSNSPTIMSTVNSNPNAADQTTTTSTFLSTSSSSSTSTEQEQENDMWASLLPPETLIEHLNTNIPIDYHLLNPRPRDILTYPYGCITHIGIQHMYKIGETLRSRKGDRDEDGDGNIRRTMIKGVRATNYQRTQASTQALISGLLGYKEPTTMSKGVLKKEDQGEDVQVEVRHIESCAMSFYEGRQKLATSLVGNVVETDAYRMLEKGGLPVFIAGGIQPFNSENEITKTKDLREECQEVVEAIGKLFPAMMRQTLDGQDTLDWIAANDYYACRIGNEIDTDYPHPKGVHKSLRRYEHFVRCMVAHRYGTYFSDPVKIAHFAVPLLVDAIELVESHHQEEGEEEEEYIQRENVIECTQESLEVFSCHDVTLLGLLFALHCPLALSPDQFVGWPETPPAEIRGSHSESATMIGSTRSLGVCLGQQGRAAYLWPDYGSTLEIRCMSSVDDESKLNDDLITVTHRELYDKAMKLPSVEYAGRSWKELLNVLKEGGNDATTLEVVFESKAIKTGVVSETNKPEEMKFSLGDLKRHLLRLLIAANESQ
jgi:hypothetical protein